MGGEHRSRRCGVRQPGAGASGQTPERDLRAQLAAEGEAAPVISYLIEIESGDTATAIARAATGCGAALVVLGARRPHAFGLLHPDVRDSIVGRLTRPVRIPPLQEHG